MKRSTLRRQGRFLATIGLIGASIGFLSPGRSGVLAEPGQPAERPVAIVDGYALTWSHLLPSMAEAAGGQVLQELVLDLRLARRAAEQHVNVTDDDLRAERQKLVESMRRNGATADEAERLIAELKRVRGLGEVRFAALLRRNAILRALVRDQVQVGPEAVKLAHEIGYGPRVAIRIATLPTRPQAVAFREGVQKRAAEPAGIRNAFIELALAQSTDESAARGGRIEPFSPADPAYPAAVRGAASGLEPGGLSDVVELDGGFAVILLEGRVAATETPLSAVADRLEGEVRARQERMAMDRAARQLLAESGVNITDRGLAWSWDQVLPQTLK